MWSTTTGECSANFRHLVLMGEMRDTIKETYEEKIRQTQQELEQKRIDQVQQMADDHRNEVQRLERNILMIQKEKDELGETIILIKEESKEKTDKLLQRINDCEAVREALIRDHAKALRNKDKEIHSLNEGNGELQDTMNSQTQAHKDRIHDLSSQNAQLSSEKDALEIKFETLKKTHKDGMKKLRVKNCDFEGQNDDLKAQVTDLRKEKEELSKQLSTTKDEFSVKVVKLTAEKESLQENYKALVDNFKYKVKKQEALNSQLIADKEKLVNKLEKATEETKAIEKHTEIKMLSHSELSVIYNKITGEKASFDNKSEIHID
jgi:chromosome segregation ATPase